MTTIKIEDLPLYRCHKKVRAAKIVGGVIPDTPCAFPVGDTTCGYNSMNHKFPDHATLSLHKFTPPEGSPDGLVVFPTLYLGGHGCAGESIGVSPDYIRKHNPQPGGYFVVYDDGYQSFSPAEAFEEGYRLAY
jgi:hypothetical protein